ncbi:MAG: hypothetical protein OEX00_01330 [Gammaproteobacteria bacterium]|nr:hypothetical protein [Gammaproteobacteria bacterium]MDH5693416.1 hypothetical protein [Gammaproteobacteria bacterium]
MDTLNHPAFQAAVAPFFVAIAVAFILGKIRLLPQGIALPLAWLSTVWLTIGFSFSPLTSTRKIVLIALITLVIGVVLDITRTQKKSVMWLTSFATMACAIWIIWPTLQRQEGADYWSMLLLSSFYCLWIVYTSHFSAHKAKASSVAILALGLGTGVSALLGATAMIGQLGSAFAAAAGAFITLILLKSEVKTGFSFMLPASSLIALLGVSSVVYASLPWYALAPLLLIPALTQAPMATAQHGWKKILILALHILPLSAVSIGITFYVSGAPPI